ncbi:allantoate permease [Sugiyamaella lignohabitans]|uniref:Allantoate permease n=1 Tax=Sugiyamaella lignohabitans TaxID=796027 RepID=A0A167D6W4_9ASCO|nr:allantoate permease [Sugiyamaella lignohabitans]ANB12554.1 allantoate permease [Sugiyamaella lignohabitans]
MTIQENEITTGPKDLGIVEKNATVEVGEVKDLNIKNADLAMEVAFQSYGMEIDEATNRKILRKIDLYVCGLMGIVYAVQYLDKITNSFASIMGLRTDLHISGSQYSWVGSAFYLAYLVFEFPASYSLQRFPIAKTVGAFIIAWGFVLCMTALPKNYGGFITTRIFLGMLESAVTPAFVLITSQWYKSEEQFTRMSFWSGCNGLGSIIGSLTAYGLAKRQEAGTLPIPGWRLLFVIVGVITIALGIVFILVIPDVPTKAWFLTKEEKLLVVERIRTNKQGFGNRNFKMDQVKEAFTDMRLYLNFVVMILIEIPNGGMTNFQSKFCLYFKRKRNLKKRKIDKNREFTNIFLGILLTGLGYDTLGALKMSAPQGAVEFVGLILVGLLVSRFQHRMFIAVLGTLINIVTGCLLAFPKSHKAQLVGYFLFGLSPICFICYLSCISSNTAGHTKKVIFSATTLIGYCVGNLIGPQTFIATQAPTYTSAKIAIVVCYSLSLVIIGLTYYLNSRANKIRDEKNERLPADFVNAEFADLTDFQNPEFRYAL